MKTVSAEPRIRELDGLRGLAILMVLFWHYFGCVEKPDLGAGSPLGILSFIASLCWSGVDLFFVLSGFLIGGIILDNHGTSGFLRVFWIRRCCRIVPPYFILLWAALLAGTSLDQQQFRWLFADLMPWWSYPTFTQNIAMALHGYYGGHFLGITWSLGIEEQFYLFAPLMVVVLGRRRWLSTLMPLLLIAFLLRLNSPGFHAFVTVFFRMDALLWGVCIAALIRHKTLWEVTSRYRYSILASFFILLLATAGLMAREQFGIFKLSWLAALYALLLAVALLFQGERGTAMLRSPILRYFGSIAYGLYLYHEGVAGLLHGWLRNGQPPSVVDLSATRVTLGAFAASVALAVLSFHFLEKRFLAIGQRHKYGAPCGSSVGPLSHNAGADALRLP